MTQGEALTVKRRMPDRVVWEKQRGFMAEMKRGFGVGGKNYHLAKANDVTVVVTQLEADFCHVELTADVTKIRAEMVGGAIGGTSALAIVGGGMFAFLTTAVIFPFSIIAVLPLAAAGAVPVLTSRQARQRSGNMQLALEQVLDRLEAGEIKPRHETMPSPLLNVAFEIRKAIAEGVESSRRTQRRLPPNT